MTRDQTNSVTHQHQTTSENRNASFCLHQPKYYKSYCIACKNKLAKLRRCVSLEQASARKSLGSATLSASRPCPSPPQQRQHSHQLRPFILLPYHVTDLPGDLILHLVHLPLHHLVTLVGNLATPVSHLATDPCGPTDTNRMGIWSVTNLPTYLPGRC